MPELMLEEYGAVLKELKKDVDLDIKLKLDNIKDLVEAHALVAVEAEAQPQKEAEKSDEPMTSPQGVAFCYLEINGEEIRLPLRRITLVRQEHT